MSDKEIDKAIKKITDEELVKIFVEMLKEDANRAGYLFQFLTEVINSSVAMGREGYQPITMFTLFARESNEVTEFKFHSARTGSQDLYFKFNLKRLGELINEAWLKHGKETFGDLKKTADVDTSALEYWAKAVDPDFS
jgi:hypothetical protein